MTYIEVDAEAILMNKYDKAFERYKKLSDEREKLIDKYKESLYDCIRLSNKYHALISNEASNNYEKLIDEYKKLVNLQDHEIESSTHLKHALYLMGIIEMSDPLSEEFTELLNEINESWNKANESLSKAIELADNDTK